VLTLQINFKNYKNILLQYFIKKNTLKINYYSISNKRAQEATFDVVIRVEDIKLKPADVDPSNINSVST
jgi:hypothetical protein